jgi:hypothetical protein
MVGGLNVTRGAREVDDEELRLRKMVVVIK